MIRRLLGLAALAICASAVGSANTISFYVELLVPSQPGLYNGRSDANYSGAFSEADLKLVAETVALHSPGSGFSGTVTLPRFDATDSRLGVTAGQMAVLTSVQLVVAWAAKGAVNVTNSLTTTEHFTDALATVPLTFNGPGLLDVNVRASAGPYDGDVSGAIRTDLDLTSNGAQGASICSSLGGTWDDSGAIHYCYDALANGTKKVGGSSEYTGLTSGPTIVSDLGQYYGTSDLTIDVAAGRGNYSGSAAPGVSFGGSASGGALAEIIYNYDIVSAPEPVTISLVGCALVGLGFLKRRR